MTVQVEYVMRFWTLNKVIQLLSSWFDLKWCDLNLRYEEPRQWFKRLFFIGNSIQWVFSRADWTVIDVISHGLIILDVVGIFEVKQIQSLRDLTSDKYTTEQCFCSYQLSSSNMISTLGYWSEFICSVETKLLCSIPEFNSVTKGTFVFKCWLF